MSKQMRIPIVKPQSDVNFINKVAEVTKEMQTADNLLFDKIEQETIVSDTWVTNQNKNIKVLLDGLNTLRDCLKVYEFSDMMFGAAGGLDRPQNAPASNLIDEENKDNNEPLMGAGEGMAAMVAGTCIATEAERMKKLLFRVTRGMAASYFNQFDQDGQQRCAYLVIFNNNPQDKLRVQKVCDSFMGTKIEVPDIGAMREQIAETKKSIADSQKMLTDSKKGVKAYLHSLNYTVPNPEETKTISALEVHKWLVVKEKAIFVCLNQMKVRQGTFIGFFWAPFEDQGDI